VNHLTTDGTMIVLRLFDLAAGSILPGHAAFQATLTVAAETGEHLDPVQSRDPMALDPSRIKSFAAFQSAVEIDQHALQRFQVKAASTIAQRVVTEGALGADPVLQIGMAQFGIQLLEAGKTKDKSVQQGEEDAGGRDFRVGARVRHLGGVTTQIETLVEVGVKGDQGMASLFHI